MYRSIIRQVLAGAAAISLLAACGGDGKNGQAGTAQIVRQEDAPLGQLPLGVTPTAYRLSLVTDPNDDSYTGTNEIDIRLDAPHARIWMHDLGPEMVAAKAVLEDGTEIPATMTVEEDTNGVARLDFDTPVPAGKATLILDFSAPYNQNLAGLYRADQNGRAYLASQMEPIDARRAFPCFDEARFKTPWTVTITAPEEDEVIANGALRSRDRLADGMMRNVFETTRPIQTYLLAFAVGPYDRVDAEPIPANALRADPVPLRGFAAAGKGPKLATALDATDAIITIQENYFGIPYPYGKLDLIAVPDFAYGAMENAGAIVYRESALLIDERTSLAHRLGILTTHAHELAHQWFGNLVTPAWWDDIWLNEAFATWFSFKTMHAYDPGGGWERASTRAALGAMGADSLISARQIRNPIERTADIQDAFDGITYRKGAGVLAMFETFLGEDAFREGIRIHMNRYADGNADVDDFMNSIAEGSGRPEVVDAFKSFILQPGIPNLDVNVRCDAGETGLITVTQNRYAPLGSKIDRTASSWIIPFAARVGRGDKTEIVRQLLTDRTTEIVLGNGCADWVMPNADGHGYWRFSTSSENWTELRQSYTRLSAGEQLVYADSLGAAFSAGTVSAADMLAGFEATTAGTWDAVQQPLGRIGQFMQILPESDKPALRKWVRDTYRPLYDHLSARADTELDQGETLLRDRLHTLLAATGRDSRLRSDLLGRAGRYVGINLDPDPSALPASQLGTAIAVAARDSGQAFFDSALHYALASDNQSERTTIFTALAANSGPDQLAILLKEANGSEFTGREMSTTFLNAQFNTRAQDQAWTLFKQSWMNIAARTPSVRKPQLATVVRAFCDADKAQAAADFITEHGEDISGYERSLAQSVEQSELCIALRAEKAGELAAALK